MSQILAGKVAVVTGGGSGIGAATCRALAAAGAAVAVLDLVPDGRAAVAAEIAAAGGRAAAWAVDVADAAAVEACFGLVAEAFGGIDILVNNAGIGTVHAIETMPLEAWQQVLGVNLSGPFHCIRAALPHLKRRPGAAVVNIASLAARRLSHHGGANYTAAKSGFLGLARHAAWELAGYGIRCNTLCPGPVLTPLVERTSTPEEREATRHLLPLGRWVMPEDVARAVLFFAGPDSAAITGADLDIDAGMMVGHAMSHQAYFAKRGVAFGEPPG